jgi:hypothetical protein
MPRATRLVNKNAGSGALIVGGGLVDCGAVREMEICWPSRVVLRKRALNHREGPWLKTVVLNVVGKGTAKDRVRCGPGR